MRISLFPPLRLVSGAGVALFYDKVTVEGKHRLPSGGLLVVAGPHSNHMMDSVMMGYALGRSDIFFMAYSTLYQGALVGPLLGRIEDQNLRNRLRRFEDTVRLAFLRSINLIPINRSRDGRDSHVDREQNLILLEEAAQRVADGHVLVIYPDGGSPSGYALGKVESGAGQLALAVARRLREGGQEASLVCAGINYTGFYEPFGSRVTVSFGLPDSLGRLPEPDSRPRTRQLRKALTQSFEDWIRSLAVVAPDNDPLRIEQIAGVLRGLPLGDAARVRLAAQAVAEAQLLSDEERASLYAALDEYYDSLRSGWPIVGRLLPGVSTMWGMTWWQSVPLVVLVYLGIALNGAPLWLLARRTAQIPVKLWARGQQLFGTAISIFIGWYAVSLGLIGLESRFAPTLVVPSLVMAMCSALLGGYAARRYFWATDRLFQMLNPDRYRQVRLAGVVLRGKILRLVGYGEDSGATGESGDASIG